MNDDPIVEAVRRDREKYGASFNYDVHDSFGLAVAPESQRIAIRWFPLSASIPALGEDQRMAIRWLWR